MVDLRSMHYIEACVETLNLLIKNELSSCLSAPTAGPTNVQVSNTSSTNLRVIWNRPPQNEAHGMIRQYILRYRKVECDNGSVSSLGWNEEMAI